LNAADSYLVYDVQAYSGRLTFTFRIDASGTISGSGRGVYTKATWTAKGVTQGDDGNPDPFDNCQARKTARPFRVVVTGTVIHSRANLKLALVNAAEVNAKDVPCNKHFRLQATTSHYLRDSLASVMKTPLKFNINTKKPSFDPLTSHPQGKRDDKSGKPPTDTVWSQDSTWTVKIKHP
jgi:hypothetical protein